MANTANYNWPKPTVNADTDTWGATLNTASDSIDSTVKAVSDASKNASNLNSGTVPAAQGGAGTVNGILKANGSGAVAQAIPSVDYAPPTTGAAVLAGNGSGGFSNVAMGYGMAFAGGALAYTPNYTDIAGGLGLGTMAKKNITVSIAAASGTPSDGDLWVQVSA